MQDMWSSVAILSYECTGCFETILFINEMGIKVCNRLLFGAPGL